MKNIKIVVLLVLVFLIPKLLIADSNAWFPIIPPEPSVKAIVEHYSHVYGVSKVQMERIISCESGWNTNAHNPKGEDSWGLVQINRKAHPDISIEQATNPYFSIPFLAENLSKGKSRMWSCK